jgi:LacI family transcriptional regulator
VATIRDVAERAGVSTATVSRALNGRGYASPEVRDRVRAAAADLGYVPNALARGLKTRRSRLVGLLVPELVDPLYAVVAQAVERVASAEGSQVLLGVSLDDPAREGAYLDLMLAHRIDGVLLAPAHGPESAVRRVEAAGVPAVVIDDAATASGIDAVRADNVGGGRLLAEHLLGRGCRRIAFLNGRAGSTPAREREAGFRRAFAAAGVPIDERLILPGRWEADDARQRTAALLAARPRPDAVVAASALIAVGALRALGDAGVRVPDDIAVASFDDLPFAADIDPFLTAVAQPAAAIGEAAATMLMERIAGAAAGPGREVVLPVSLVVRRSSGADLSGQAADVGADRAAP